MSSIPVVALSAISFGNSYPPYDGVSTAFSSQQLKGNGYYGYTDGLHTVSCKTTGFVGVIKMQASLSTDPTEADWFDVATVTGNGSTPVTSTVYNNFSGNFVWCRAHVTSVTAGTIDRLLYNT